MRKLSNDLNKSERLDFHFEADKFFHENGLPYPVTNIKSSWNSHYLNNGKEWPDNHVYKNWVEATFCWTNLNTPHDTIYTDKTATMELHKKIRAVFAKEFSSLYNIEFKDNESSVGGVHLDTLIVKIHLYEDESVPWGEKEEISVFASYVYCQLGSLDSDGYDALPWAYIMTPQGTDLNKLWKEWLIHEGFDIDLDSDDYQSMNCRRYDRNTYIDTDMFLAWIERDHGCYNLNPEVYN